MVAMQPAVIVTGAAGGIGQALCSAFRQAGYWVVGLDSRQEPTDAHVLIQVDLERLASDEEASLELGESVRAACGGKSISVLINNGAYQVVRPFHALALRDWQQTLNVNLLAPVMLCKLFQKDLAEHFGCIVNIASIHAHQTKPEFVAYATSKAAILGFTQALAVEVGSSIRVNAIVPAAIRTPMLEAGLAHVPGALQKLESYHPTGGIGLPAEVADLAVFMASRKLPFMNGAGVSLDGGISCRLHDPV